MATSGLLHASPPCRHSTADDVDSGEPVDALTMGRLVAQVAAQGGELDTALDQVSSWDQVSRLGGAKVWWSMGPGSQVRWSSWAHVSRLLEGEVQGLRCWLASSPDTAC